MSEAPMPAKAPVHLWIVGVAALIWFAAGSFDFGSAVLQVKPYQDAVPDELGPKWAHVPVWMWLAWAITTIGGLLGSVGLLLRRRWAISLFWAAALDAAFALALGLTMILPGGLGNSAFAGLGAVISFALVGYAIWMNRRGALR